MSIAPGVREWTQNEFKHRDAALQEAPRAVVSVVQSQIGEGYEVVEYPTANLEIEFAYHVDATNHLLALLNFPDKLRGFLSCLLGMAKQSGGEVFEATNWQLGLRSRSGRAACTDDSMEKWVSRQKKKLDEWMRLKGFEFINIINGTWNPLTGKNDPTRYQVFFNKYVVETVAEAKKIYYWNAKQNIDKARGRALREAARRVLHRIPEAPPLKPARVKILSEEEKFDRRHRAVLSFLEKNRDALAKLGIAWEEYFIFLVREMDKICENPAGLSGTILTLPQNEPVRHESIWRKIKTGTLLLDEAAERTALETMASRAFEESLENITGENLIASDNLADFLPETENQSEVLNNSENTKLLIPLSDDGGTFLSGRGDKKDFVKHDGETNLSARDDDMDTKEALKIVEQWSIEVNKKMPIVTPANKISGVWEIDWQASDFADADAGRTQDALDMTILKISRDRSSLPELREKFVDWIMARLRWWSGGVSSIPADGEIEKFRERLLKFLQIPEIGDG